MTTVPHSRLSGSVFQDHARRRPGGASRKRAVRPLAKLVALAVACAGMMAIYEIVGAAIQDGVIAAMLTLLLYLPLVTLFAKRR